MAEHPPFSVSVVTPEGAVFEGDAEMVIVPGAAGEIGVLARHAPLVALLKAGSTRVHVNEGDIREFATGHGFFQVIEDRAIALVDAAVVADEIDEAKVQRELEEAKAELERLESDEETADRWQVEKKILHAENQLRVLGRNA
jgi:F-type H+-transporting ATPase subunit epsilon